MTDTVSESQNDGNRTADALDETSSGWSVSTRTVPWTAGEDKCLKRVDRFRTDGARWAVFQGLSGTLYDRDLWRIFLKVAGLEGSEQLGQAIKHANSVLGDDLRDLDELIAESSNLKKTSRTSTPKFQHPAIPGPEGGSGLGEPWAGKLRAGQPGLV